MSYASLIAIEMLVILVAVPMAIVAVVVVADHIADQDDRFVANCRQLAAQLVCPERFDTLTCSGCGVTHHVDFMVVWGPEGREECEECFHIGAPRCDCCGAWRYKSQLHRQPHPGKTGRDWDVCIDVAACDAYRTIGTVEQTASSMEEIRAAFAPAVVLDEDLPF